MLSDGGMGTMLNASGIGFEQCLDAVNLTKPDLVAEIHQAYIDAGAEIIQTNTFGANAYKLSEHDLGDQVSAINKAGVDIARQAAQVSGIELAAPVFAAVIGYIVLEEPVTVMQVIGMIFLFIGVFLIISFKSIFNNPQKKI